MRKSLRQAVRTLALTTALAACAPLIAIPAYAEDPQTTGVAAVDDAAALGTDTAADLLAGCFPFVRKWEPIFTVTPLPPTANGSVYYREEGGGIAHLSCSAPLRWVTRMMDDVGQLSPVPYRVYKNSQASEGTTDAPRATAVVSVPYVGPDAPVVRPFGHVTVQVMVYRKLSTGRYAEIRSGCMEWVYVIQPTTHVTSTDPREQGTCGYDPIFLAADTLDGQGLDDLSARVVVEDPIL
jgi:hypothetical protein